MSEDSFESTDHTDCTVDLCEKEGLSHSSFQFNDVVWVKRPLLPWFPGIVSFCSIFIHGKLNKKRLCMS